MKKKSTIVVCVMCLLTIFLLTGCGGDGTDITLEQFNRIEVGMSYSQVVAIFGRDGEFNHEAGTTRVYRWPNSRHSALITIIFIDGYVNTTAQIGLD